MIALAPSYVMLFFPAYFSDIRSSKFASTGIDWQSVISSSGCCTGFGQINFAVRVETFESCFGCRFYSI
jgi:hypothetical protein